MNMKNKENLFVIDSIYLSLITIHLFIYQQGSYSFLVTKIKNNNKQIKEKFRSTLIHHDEDLVANSLINMISFEVTKKTKNFIEKNNKYDKLTI